MCTLSTIFQQWNGARLLISFFREDHDRVYPTSMLIIRRWNYPGHPQPCYWTNYPGIFLFNIMWTSTWSFTYDLLLWCSALKCIRMLTLYTFVTALYISFSFACKDRLVRFPASSFTELFQIRVIWIKSYFMRHHRNLRVVNLSTESLSIFSLLPWLTL